MGCGAVSSGAGDFVGVRGGAELAQPRNPSLTGLEVFLMWSKAKQYIATGVALVGGLVSSAQAAVPSSVTSALSDAATDSATVAGLALGVAVGIMAFRYMRRAL